MKYEKSCGAVLFKIENNQILFLVVKYKKGEDYWGLVKGHREKNETKLDTAIREIYEEVGLKDIHFIDSFRETHSYSPDVNVWKEVTFFLAEAKSTDIQFL